MFDTENPRLTDEVNTLNTIARMIKILRRKSMMAHRAIDYEPNIIIYVGQKQIHELRTIERGDRYEVVNDVFRGATVVEVRKDDYFHVVEY